jgi:DivIVA domain-containing protein
MDRKSIERKDFPVVRRGYDPAAVDSHLSALSDELEELKRGSHHGPAHTLAGSVSEQVRGIVEAAESSAEEILRSAELEAQEIRAQAAQAAAQARQEASGQAQRRREQAAVQARDYVARLSALLEQLEKINGELNSLTTSLRGDTDRLHGELAALDDELEGARAATGISEPAPQMGAVEPSGVPADVSEPVAAPADVSEPVAAPADVSEPVAAPADVSEPVAAPLAAPESAASTEVEEPAVQLSEGIADVDEPAAEYSSHAAKIGDEPVAEFPAAEAGAVNKPAAPGVPASEDTEGARLIALNMALNGTPREETERYLAEHCDVADRQRLLDEVYASVDG